MLIKNTACSISNRQEARNSYFYTDIRKEKRFCSVFSRVSTFDDAKKIHSILQLTSFDLN